MILYADVMFIVNFSMDFLALFLCGKLLNRKIRKKRILISSAIGAVYGVLQYVLDFGGVIGTLICVFAAYLMCYICYKDKKMKNLTVLSLMFLFVSATLGGLMSLVYGSLNSLLHDIVVENGFTGEYKVARHMIIVIFTIIISILISKAVFKAKSVKEAEMKIVINSKTFILKGLCDSGNNLKEPFSSKSVILLSAKCPAGDEICRIADLKKRIVPYKDVSGEGIIKAAKADKIYINDIEKDAYVATVTNEDFNGYEALIPGALL